jgi:hypothetical protein
VLFKAQACKEGETLDDLRKSTSIILTKSILVSKKGSLRVLLGESFAQWALVTKVRQGGPTEINKLTLRIDHMTPELIMLMVLEHLVLEYNCLERTFLLFSDKKHKVYRI